MDLVLASAPARNLQVRYRTRESGSRSARRLQKNGKSARFQRPGARKSTRPSPISEQPRTGACSTKHNTPLAKQAPGERFANHPHHRLHHVRRGDSISDILELEYLSPFKWLQRRARTHATAKPHHSEAPTRQRVPPPCQRVPPPCQRRPLTVPAAFPHRASASPHRASACSQLRPARAASCDQRGQRCRSNERCTGTAEPQAAESNFSPEHALGRAIRNPTCVSVSGAASRS